MVKSEAIHFSNPPLNEVVLGVHFSNTKLAIEHFGHFFQNHEPNFVATKLQHPLPAAGALTPGLAFVTEPELPRVWFEFAEKPFLVQLQGDRFILNWRKVDGLNNEYPHFSEVYERFAREWDQFLAFCTVRSLATPKVEQLELTYINHLVKGQHWTSLEDLTASFKSLAFTSNYSSVSAMVLELKYTVDGISVVQSYKPAKTQTGQDLYVVEFKTRAKVSTSDEAKTLMKKSNNVLAEEFLRASSDSAQKKWGFSRV
jgi:uncharacterized protein (TIGR04255 family)